MTDPALLPNGPISFLRHALFDFETNLDRFRASEWRHQPENFPQKLLDDKWLPASLVFRQKPAVNVLAQCK